MTKERADMKMAISKDTPKEQVCEGSEDIKARIVMLETERIAKATQEIQAILDKYGVILQAVAVIPASQINIVPAYNNR